MGLSTDFPDPTFLKAADGKWYAFGSNGNDKRIQVAKSTDFNTWTLLNIDALTTLSTWETDKDHWAPSVILRHIKMSQANKQTLTNAQDDGKYVMYYSGESKLSIGHHCIGTAISESPTGPYIPSNTPLSCRLNQGGSIDPSGFQDADGTRYAVFKVDGNSIGHGGDCNNGIEPLVQTPIMIQKLQADGVTPVGDAVQILDRDTVDNDGPLVEAPSLLLHQGVYYLFYSTHCYTDKAYDLRWATASSIGGPYRKKNVQLLETGQHGLTSPGSATVCGCGDRMLFHGFCNSAKTTRCMYVADVSLSGEDAVIS
ncbi:hypothetical protein N7478_009179 [Penicillium angulare]|uniref:uncharacterized protein n=1 Tax=Penicillium angulare TaxID=116970 RepID=UPI002541EC5B|nr:uncharacterized protein N7478_009179 [Penicillium angulare]KAJ5274054.1 hypothetical protein N7478_009179 [Penicillium angulare]